MRAIVSVTRDWAIGNQGKLLVRNREDMRFFREQTMGGTVVCGRKTFQSFPGGALKGRRNVVLSADTHFAPADSEVVHSLQELFDAIATDDLDRVWVIGGERVYDALLEACTHALVTVHDCIRPADTYFANLDASDAWRLVQRRDGGTTPEGVAYEFRTYERVTYTG